MNTAVIPEIKTYLAENPSFAETSKIFSETMKFYNEAIQAMGLAESGSRVVSGSTANTQGLDIKSLSTYISS